MRPQYIFRALAVRACLLLSICACAAVAAAEPIGQAISWVAPAADILSLNTPHPIEARATSGLPVALRVVAGPATIADGMITVTGVGTVVVRAEQAGNAEYQPTYAGRRFNARHVALDRLGGLQMQLALGLDVVGDYAYIGAGVEGLKVVDVSNPASPVIVGGAPSYTARTVHVVEGLAYVADDQAGLKIFDVSVPTSVREVGRFDTAGQAWGVFKAGNFAYVADNQNGLEIIDVSNPGAPARVGRFAGGYSIAVQVVGNLAYLADGTGGLKIVDVSNPANPTLLGEIAITGLAYGIKVEGDRAYVSGWEGGIEVIDIRDPAAPRRVGGYLPGFQSFSVDVANGYAFLPLYGFGLHVYDLTGDQPVYAGATAIAGGAYRVKVVGNRVYSTLAGLSIFEASYGYPNGINYLLLARYPMSARYLPLLATSTSGEAVNWSVVSGPARVVENRLEFTGPGTIRFRADQPSGGAYLPVRGEWTIEVFREAQSISWTGPSGDVLAIGQSHAFGAVSSSGLPVTVRVVGGPATYADGLLTVTGAGTVMVVAEQAGGATHLPATTQQRRFNVRTARLTELSSLPGYGGTGVDVEGDFAYVSRGGAFIAVRISDPARPQITATGNTADARRAQVRGGMAYIADGTAGLRVYDARTTGVISALSRFDTPGEAVDVFKVGNLAYVADGSGGLQIVDVSNPSAPTGVGAYRGEDVTELLVGGNVLYAANGTNGLAVFDVSVPANPRLLRKVATTTGPGTGSLDVEGNIAYLTTAGSGLEMFDVSDPAAPRLVGAPIPNAYASAVDVANGYAFTGIYSYGLRVYDLTGGEPFSVGGLSNTNIARGGEIADVHVVGDIVYVAELDTFRILRAEFGYTNEVIFNPARTHLLQAGPLSLPGTSTSGQAIMWSVASGPARVTGNMLEFQAAGEVRLRADQPSDGLYLPARGEWTFEVIRSPQTISWTGVTASILAIGQSHALGATASSGLPVTLRVERGPAVIEDGMLRITGAGKVVVSASQGGNEIWAPAPRLERSFNVQAGRLVPVASVATGGSAYGLHVVGNYAYVAAAVTQSGMYVVDISDPTNPRVVGSYRIGNYAQAVHVVGNRAYLVDWNAGLHLLDVSNPASPVRLGQWTAAGSFYAVDVAGNYAYVADWASGMKVVDVSDAANPRQVGWLQLGTETYDVRVAGDYAYVAAGQEGMQVVDIRVPSNPIRPGFYNSPGFARGVAVAGNLVYVADLLSGLAIVDVTSAWQPGNAGAVSLARVGGIDTPGEGMHVEIAGNYAFVADGPNGIVMVDVFNPASPEVMGGTPPGVSANDVNVRGNYAYASGAAGLQVFRIEMGYPNSLNFTPPALTYFDGGSMALPRNSSNGEPVTYTVVSGPGRIDEGGRLVFTGIGRIELRATQNVENYLPIDQRWLIDVARRPQSITWAGAPEVLAQNTVTPLTATASSGLPVRFEVENGPAVIEEGGLRITGYGTVVVTARQDGNAGFDPATPVRRVFNLRRARLVPVSAAGGFANGLDLAGDYAFVGGHSFQAVNVSNPLAPVAAGAALAGDFAQGVDVVGNLAYVAADHAGLKIFDVSDPARPALVGTYAVLGRALGVQAVGAYAYVAAGDGGLQVVNVSNPAAPDLTAQFGTEGPAVGVHVSGNLAYISTVHSLRIVDISNPSAPALVGSFSGEGVVSTRAHVVGNYAYLGGQNRPLTVLDVSNPRDPRMVAEVQYPGYEVYDLHAAGGYLYLADQSSGALVFDLAEPGTPRLVSDNLNMQGFGIRARGEYVYLAAGELGTRVMRLEFGYPNSLDFTPPSSIRFDQGPVDLPATSSIGAPVTFRVVSGPARVEGNRLVLTGRGQVRLSVSQEPVLDFLGISGEWTIQVLGLAQSIEWETPESAVLSLNTAHPLRARASSGGPVTFRVLSGPATIESAMITATGGEMIAVEAAQAGNEIYGPATARRVFNLRGQGLTEVGRLAASEAAWDVEVAGDYAYVQDGAAIQIVDVRNPAQPTEVGRHRPEGEILDYKVAGDLMFVASGGSGMEIVDVIDPRNPVRVGIFSGGREYRQIAARGRIVYLADSNGFDVIDATDPALSVSVARVELGEWISAVTLADGYLYVGRNGEVVIYDVQEPTNPVEIGRHTSAGYVQQIEAVGDRLYLNTTRFIWWEFQQAALEVVDVTDRTSPRTMGELLLPFGYVRDLEMAGALAFASAGQRILEVDASVPEALEVGHQHLTDPNMSDEVFGIEAANGHLYVASAWGGLVIYGLHEGYVQRLNWKLGAPVSFQREPYVGAVTASSGLPVTLTVLEGPAVVENGALILQSGGWVALEARQEGNEFFLPETQVFYFTVGPPRLRLETAGSDVRLMWDAGLENVRLQSRGSLQPEEAWEDYWVDMVTENGQVRAQIPNSGGERYFRAVLD